MACVRGGNVWAVAAMFLCILPTLLLAEKSRLMPTLFSKHDIQYDRYAACLAATEGLRRIRDAAIAERSGRRGRTAAAAQDEARVRYVRDAEGVVNALGMSIVEYNRIGSQLARDRALRDKVRM
jgi:Domain of unknown function (DUF4168)